MLTHNSTYTVIRTEELNAVNLKCNMFAFIFTLNDFLRKFVTIGTSERTAVNGRPFCAISSFIRYSADVVKLN